MQKRKKCKGNNIKNRQIAGHMAVLFTIIIWGTTFISTKIMLTDFQPVEILFFRFLMGFLALLIVCPNRMERISWKQEGLFAIAGLCGICLYYLLENIALTLTMASNVGVIISVAPFFTAMITHFVVKGEERLRVSFFAGFVVAMLAALVWACYSVLTRKIGELGYPTIMTTRKMFFYGILFMIPTLFFFDFRLKLERFANPVYLGNILFLGLGASAMCFVTWNLAVKMLGAVKTSVYIYIVPVITVVTSVLILHEKVTLLAGAGIILTLVGLFLSEGKLEVKKRNGRSEADKN